METMQKVKEWVTEHKKVIMVGVGIGGAALVSSAIGVKLRNSSNSKSEEMFGDIILHAVAGRDEFKRAADEAIFTELAPMIEDCLFDDRVKRTTFRKPFDLGNNVHRLVTVVIENIEKE